MALFCCRSDHHPDIRHGRARLLGDGERGGAREIQDRPLALRLALHHQPAGPRDLVRGLSTRVLGVGSICSLLIEEVSLGNKASECRNQRICCRKK